MAFDAAFWATIALIVFLGVMVYLKVPGMITGSLDKQIKKIEEELEEAKRLRVEAQNLFASYETKRKAADKEAEEIIAAAREEADRLTSEAEVALEDMIARRTRAVEDKIAQAEAQALGEVRERSADLAIEAARVLLQKEISDKGDTMIDQSIKEVAAKLN